MTKMRYRIEASIMTLKRFVDTVHKEGSPSDAFIQKVTPDTNEEYYYVVLLATDEVHKELKQQRFVDSTIAK